MMTHPLLPQRWRWRRRRRRYGCRCCCGRWGHDTGHRAGFEVRRRGRIRLLLRHLPLPLDLLDDMDVVPKTRTESRGRRSHRRGFGGVVSVVFMFVFAAALPLHALITTPSVIVILVVVLVLFLFTSDDVAHPSNRTDGGRSGSVRR